MCGFHPAVTLTFLAACVPSSKPHDTCDVAVVGTDPSDAGTDAYWRAPVTFELSAPDPDASVVLVDAGGVAVPGATAVSGDGRTVTFTPDQPLTCSTGYAATLALCGGLREADVSFRTSELGCGLDTDLTGRSWEVDLHSAEWISPPYLPEVVVAFGGPALMLSVASADAATMDAFAAWRDHGSGEQDTCVATVTLPSADFSEQPYFVAGPVDGTLGPTGSGLPVHDFTIDGTFSLDGDRIGGGRLSGFIDARELDPTAIGVEDWEGICELFAAFTADCEPCEDAVEACLPIEVRQIEATEAPGLLTEEVGTTDCHEACVASCENADCAEAAEFEVCEG